MREVSPEEGAAFAREHGCLYKETSAKVRASGGRARSGAGRFGSGMRGAGQRGTRATAAPYPDIFLHRLGAFFPPQTDSGGTDAGVYDALVWGMVCTILDMRPGLLREGAAGGRRHGGVQLERRQRRRNGGAMACC